MDVSVVASSLPISEELFTPAEEVALAGFLAGYSGLTREAYTSRRRSAPTSNASDSNAATGPSPSSARAARP